MVTPFLLLLLSRVVVASLSSQPPHRPSSHIVVMGVVYCDICCNNNFSQHSYFMPGAKVNIDCRFNALSPETAEQISFSVNRTTNKSGVYRLEIPSIEGIECGQDTELVSSCQASLIKTPANSLCNVPGYSTTSDVMTIKSKEANLCFYSFSPLNFKPMEKDPSFCGGA